MPVQSNTQTSDGKEPGVKSKTTQLCNSTPRNQRSIQRNDNFRKSFPKDNCRKPLSKQLSGSFEQELSSKQGRHLPNDSESFSRYFSFSKSQKISPCKESSPSSGIPSRTIRRETRSNESLKDYTQSKDNVFHRLTRNLSISEKQNKNVHAKHRTKENSPLSSSVTIKLLQTDKFIRKSSESNEKHSVKFEENDQTLLFHHHGQQALKHSFLIRQQPTENDSLVKNGILHHSNSNSSESISNINEKFLSSEINAEFCEISQNFRPKLLPTPPVNLGGPNSAFCQLSPRQVSINIEQCSPHEFNLSKNEVHKQLSLSQGSITTSPVGLPTEFENKRELNNNENTDKSLFLIKKKQVIQISNSSSRHSLSKLSPQLSTNVFTPIQGYPLTPSKTAPLIESNSSQNLSAVSRKPRLSLPARSFKKDTFPLTMSAVKKAERLLLDAHQEELQESAELSREELKLLQSVRHGQRAFSEYLKILDDMMSTKIQVIETLRSQISEVSLYRKHMSPKTSLPSFKNL